MGNDSGVAAKLAKYLRKRTVATMLLTVSVLTIGIIAATKVTSVNIIDGGERKTVITMRHDTKSILTQAGIAIDNEDEVVVNRTDNNYKEIEILRAFDVSIIADGEEKSIQMVSGTVADAIDEAQIIQPDSDDIINVNVTEPLTDGMVIQIDRVEYLTETKTEEIAFETITKEDSTLASGKTQVSVEGVNGQKELSYEVKYVNGEKVSEEFASERVVKKAVDEVVLKGTKKTTTTTTTKKAATKAKSDSSSSSSSESSTSSDSNVVIDANGNPLTYKKLLTGTGTAYTAEKGALTATGKAVKVGYVAVNPSVIPYGTRMYIVSADGKFVYGEAIAADTGGALKSNKVIVDLFYNTKSECTAFGRRKVNIYIL